VPLDQAIARVVDQGNCSGCGACVLLDSGLHMGLDSHGFNRPVRQSTSVTADDVTARFAAMCPGVVVRAQRPALSRRHPTMGPYVEAFEAWASDDEIRYAGSSGGALTALSAWLISTGEASRVVSATVDSAAPRRTVTVEITTREKALALAGSRYAPASNAAASAALDPAAAFVGKPCEVSALRAMQGGTGPLLLSFFCAGTPSQHATDSLAEKLGVPTDEPIRDLWYRGRGWPGRFTVVRHDGSTVDTSYDESWGQSLGPAVQWRCKICVDGVGESADVTAADFWRADERGYPDFSEGPGVSALIARTERGLDVIRRAIAAGVLAATRIDIADLAAVQPLQRTRRETLSGRLAGTVAAGGRVPRYRGFSLLALAMPRLRDTYRTAKGTFRRRRAKANPDD
jgi:coenzyme F420 hydrogenase subunit beta